MEESDVVGPLPPPRVRPMGMGAPTASQGPAPHGGGRGGISLGDGALVAGPYSGPLSVPQTPAAWRGAKTHELGTIFWRGIHDVLQAEDQWAAVRRQVLAAC